MRIIPLTPCICNSLKEEKVQYPIDGYYNNEKQEGYLLTRKNNKLILIYYYRDNEYYWEYENELPINFCPICGHDWRKNERF